MSIMDKLHKNSKIKTTDILSDSIFFGQKSMVKTEVPMINVALSGDPQGGLNIRTYSSGWSFKTL